MEINLHLMLKEYGLNEGETKIYLYLVANKELTAYRIAKNTKIHRSTCYDILEKLIQRGFISKIEKEKSSFYSANDISRVISSLKVKEELLKSMIPKIHELESKEETNIKYLEGVEGQNHFNLKLFNLAKNKEISYCYIIGNTYASTEGSNILIEKLILELKKNKKLPEYRGIWNSRYKKDKIIRKYNLVGKNKFLDVPSNVGTVVYEKGVAFLYTFDKSYTIDITNKKLAEEFKAYFEYLWKIAKD